MKKQKIDPKIISAQDFINVEDIADDVIYSKDGYLFGFLKVKAGDTRLLSQEEQLMKANRVADALMTGDNDPFTILSMPRTVDTTSMIEYLVSQRNQTRQDAKLKLLNGEISSLQEMARQGTKEPMILIKRWIKAQAGADAKLKDWLMAVRANLADCSVHAEILGTKEIIYVCKVFADLTEYQSSEEEVFEDVPLLPGQPRKITMKDDDAQTNMLRNLITPVGGLSFGVSKTVIGPVVGRIYGATRYPSEISYGWGIDIMNSSNSITAITYYPGSTGEMAEALSKSMSRNQVEAETAKDARQRKRFARKVADADVLLDQMEFKRGCIGHVSIVTMPFTATEEKLNEICSIATRRFSTQRIKLQVLGNLQKEGFMTLAPYHVPQPVIEDISKRLIPLESLAGGFPLTVNIFRDDKGMYFARTMDGGIISLDLDYRAGDRTNGNIFVTGESGQGKSTAIKHIIQSRYMQGTRCIIIDPEREFRDMCKSLGGAWVDIGGGSSKINPLQIRPVPKDEEEDVAYKAEDNAMALHIRSVETFFSFYIPGLMQKQIALLKRHLIKIYKESGITWEANLSELSAEQFPIITDLYNSLVGAETEKAACQELALLLEDMAVGADSFLWNGHTNISLDSDFIVLDTNRLTSSTTNVKQAQYYNALTLCWEYMTQHRDESVMLVADEAHIIMDPACPQGAAYLKNIAKRCRKYEGSLVTVFQSVADALHERVKEYGQAILDNASYKILFGCDGRNLQETAEMYQLTDAEKNILSAKVQKTALAIIGAQHVKVRFEIPKYKLELMGKGGGR